jgi:hypothetical protein
MFCAPRLDFGGTEGVGSCFHFLRSRTRFRRYRGRRVPFSRFALPASFSAVSGASGPVFLFCAPGLFFGGTEGVRSCFHVLRSRTRFRRYRGRRVPFLRFALPDKFSAVLGASGPVFMFCAPVLLFIGTGDVGSRFLVLRSRTRFRWYRGLRVKFSCFALPDSFSTELMAYGPVSCFARTDSFSAVRRASRPVFMFCTPGFIFDGGVWPRFGGTEAYGLVLMFCASRLVFGGTEVVVSRFHVLHTQTCFGRYLGRPIPFSCFARPDSFSAVPRASLPVFMFSAPGHIFGDTDGVGSSFHVLRAWSSFRRYRGRRVPFSSFARPGSFSVITRASGPVF